MNQDFNYIVDSHCHLDLLEEKGIKLDEIIKNCEKNKVRILQTICTKFSEIDKILAYSKKHSSIYCSIGNHPCNVKDETFKKAEELIEICRQEKRVIGIGETGLDYFHSQDYVDLQKKFFIEHVNVSCETNLPLIIHSRNADQAMGEILVSEQRNRRFPALLHCFSSSYELAKTALDLGIFISISGIVSFKNAESLQEIVRKIPLEFLLVETDSPYLAPNPHRGQINQPSYTSIVVDHIAKLKNLPVETVINETTKNFHRLFLRSSPLTDK